MAAKCKECVSVHQFLNKCACIGVQVQSLRATIQLGLLSYQVDNMLGSGESIVYLMGQNSCPDCGPPGLDRNTCINSPTCSKSGDGGTQTFGLRNRPIRPPDWPLPDTIFWVKYTCRDPATCLFYLQGQTGTITVNLSSNGGGLFLSG